VKYLLALMAAVLLSACASTGNSDNSVDNGQRPSMDKFGNMAMPAGTKLRTGDSLIFGAADGWLGRAVFEIPTDANQTYNFFADQMPRQGWNMVASVRGKKSLLVFTRTDRSATLEIEDAGLFGSAVVYMTVGPTGSSGGAPAGAGVVVQPLGGAARRP
jgi:hypothetical protein